jgi:hypothetical protein
MADRDDHNKPEAQYPLLNALCELEIVIGEYQVDDYAFTDDEITKLLAHTRTLKTALTETMDAVIDRRIAAFRTTQKETLF